MNESTLEKYGISFYKEINGNIKVTAKSSNLDIFLYMFSRNKRQITSLLNVVSLALKGSYSSIPYDEREWQQELGRDLYTGIIHENLTFELFLEDHYDQTCESYPLPDIAEIFESLRDVIT